jgi:moderate conductance mechanosensitive channel
MSFFLQLKSFVPELHPFVVHAIRIVVILGVAYIAAWLIVRSVPTVRRRIVRRMTRHGSNVELEKRAATISGVFRKSMSAVIWIIAAIMALREGGFDIAPILAGAGVVGLAVGFGAQNLVRDVISGVFLLLEDQIRVNDVAVINGTGGLVEQINLRTTVLRGLDGTVYVFPNGSVTTLANMTHGYSYYLFDIGVAYKEDTDHVVEVLQEIANGMMNDDAYKQDILEPLEVLGVDKFADSAVIIKVRIKTMPIRQWVIGREMNRRIKKEFDRLGIEIPFPHMSVNFGEASKPFALNFQKSDREELKNAIREVLSEELRQVSSESAERRAS